MRGEAVKLLKRLFGYDETKEPDRCGVGPLSTDERDPYHDACAWHDKATLKRSWHALHMKVRKVNSVFKRQMREIKDALVAKCYGRGGTVGECEGERRRLNRRRKLYGFFSDTITRFFAKDPPK